MTSFIRSIVRWAPRILALLALVSILVPAQVTLAAGNWYVAPGGSDSNTCADTSHPCATIQAAVDKAASGDTVYVAVGTYTGSVWTGVVFLNNKNLFLTGGWNTNFTIQNGISILDGENRIRGATIVGDGTMVNFLIQNGLAYLGDYQMGGGIIHSNGTLTLIHIVITSSRGIAGGGIYNTGNLEVTNGWISGNTAGEAGYTGWGGGGGIYAGGTVTLNNTLVSENTNLGGFSGVGILVTGTLIMNNSTVSGNWKDDTMIDSTAIVTEQNSHLYLNNSTIAFNRVGGVAIAGTMQIQNTMLAENYGVDCSVTYTANFSSLGYNLVEGNKNCPLVGTDLTNIDPRLDLLNNNGGYSLTHALLSGSPAINAGNPAGCSGSNGDLLTDQRGYARQGRCDIGAYEAQATTKTFLSVLTKGSDEPHEPGLKGHVTLDRSSAPGEYLELNFYNGQSWSVIGSTFTDENGNYLFPAPTSLTENQVYCVTYFNLSETYNNRIALWMTRYLRNYTSGELVNIGDFDIGDVRLVYPTPPSNSLFLPGNFIWDKRYGMRGDSYQLDVYEPTENIEFLSPMLGFVRSYWMGSLPYSFNTHQVYHWEVLINSSDGGLGISYYAGEVAFDLPYTTSSSLNSSELRRNIVDRIKILNKRLQP